VSLGSNKKIKGVVLTDQIKSVDWQGRRAELISRKNEVVLEKVKGLLRELI
jgi:mRNA-degrading endonuclease toxin of MazEF toxin-antitoxin module